MSGLNMQGISPLEKLQSRSASSVFDSDMASIKTKVLDAKLKDVPKRSSSSSGGTFDTAKFAGKVTAGINAAGQVISGYNNIKNNTDANTAVYGDSSADPLARAFADATGASTKNAIKNIKNADAVNVGASASSNEDLLSMYSQGANSMGLMDRVKAKGFGMSNIIDNHVASFKGAAQGMQFGGPWGALVGGIIGGAANIFSQAGAKKRRKKINEAIEQRNKFLSDSFTSSFQNAAANTDSKLDRQSMNVYAYGGDMGTGNSQQYMIENGGYHEDNPMGGVPMGTDDYGTPNLVEQGEYINGDTVISNRIPANQDLAAQLRVRYRPGDSLADLADRIEERYKETPNDPLSKRAKEEELALISQYQTKVQQEQQQEQQAYAQQGMQQEQVPQEVPQGEIPQEEMPYDNGQQEPVNILARGGNMGGLDFNTKFNENKDALKDYYETSYFTKEKEEPFKERFRKWSRDNLIFAPVVGSALSTFNSFMKGPDYRHPDSIQVEADKLSQINPSYLGNYVSPQYVDPYRGINLLNAQANATNRGIMQNSNGNIGAMNAALLASNNQYNAAMQEMAMRNREENWKNRLEAAKFNRETDQYNSEMNLKSQMQKQELAGMRLQAAMRRAEMKQDIDNRLADLRSANLTNLFDNIGNVGVELQNREDARFWLETQPGISLPVEWQIKKYGVAQTRENLIERYVEKLKDEHKGDKDWDNAKIHSEARKQADNMINSYLDRGGKPKKRKSFDDLSEREKKKLYKAYEKSLK